MLSWIMEIVIGGVAGRPQRKNPRSTPNGPHIIWNICEFFLSTPRPRGLVQLIRLFYHNEEAGKAVHVIDGDGVLSEI